MKRSQAISINIPQPCREDWDKMTPTEKGKYCSNCNKTVIDFSLYSDKELNEFFSTLSTHVCGRFSNYQLNRPLIIPEQNRFSFFYRLFFGTALVSWFGLLFSAEAKGSNPIQVEQQAQKKKQHSAGGDSLKQCVHGIVCAAKDGAHLGNAVVYIKEVPECQTYADSNGRFTLKIPDSLVGKKLTIGASQSMYASTEIAFIAKKTQVYKELRLAISPDAYRTMGAPMPTKIDTSKVIKP